MSAHDIELQLQTLERIDQLESPVARRVLRTIAEGMYSGRLSGEDMELLGGIAEQMADRTESSLTSQEQALLTSFRRITVRQRVGVMLLLSTVEEL